MITKIKNYILAFVSGALAIFGIYVWKTKVQKQSDLKTDKAIADNNKTANDAKQKTDDVVKQKTEVVKTVVAEEKKIEEIKDEIKTVSVDPVEDVSVAKENIIKKTRRKGRRPNKNKTATTKTTK